MQKKLLVPPKTISVPARTLIAVNKSVLQLGEKTKIKKGNVTLATDGDKKFDDIFAETLEIAVALIPTVSFSCRPKDILDFGM